MRGHHTIKGRRMPIDLGMSQKHGRPRGWVRGLSAVALAAALAWMPTAFADGVTQAWVGGTVHPVSGEPITDAVVLVQDGKITAVGQSVEVPAGATVVELRGQHLYPGFVHPASVLGLVEIDSVRGSIDTNETTDVNAELRAEVAFNADSLLLPPSMAGGVLTAHVVPRGGVFAGTSAVMALDGWNWEDMTLATPVGMHLNYPQLLPSEGDVSEEEETEQREKALKLINETLDAAQIYRQARDAVAQGTPAIDFDADYEALLPVLDGELPLFIWASEKSQIEGALDWTKERQLSNIVLVTGADAQYVAERLAAEEVSVILGGVLALPERRWEPYDSAYTAAATLHAAGVRFCIGDSKRGRSASEARNLPFHAAMAASFGLPKDVALRSVTLSSAEILGVDDRVGSIEVGKDATFMVTNGDPLEILTQIERVWVQGHEVDLSADHQRRLYEKYRHRPRPEKTSD